VNLIRLILFPFSLVYGIIAWIRNKFFDWGFLPSKKFNIPVISVGNLTTGGTGKTPHIEYLIRLLGDEFKVAVLSRGYKRKSKGFILASEGCTPEKIGDEPFQIFAKFRNVVVAVDEKRVRGITQLRKHITDTDVILLDDAFQHRYVKPGISILLTDYHKLYTSDYPLPTGNLREFRNGADRADIIIVTKSSKFLSPITCRRVEENLNPKAHQKLYYSYIDHGKFSQIPGIEFSPDKKGKYNTILLVAGIANTYPLEYFIRSYCEEMEILKFQDHHQYIQKDIINIIETFDNIVTQNKMIVTTEKDLVKLNKPEFIKILINYPICYVPIEIIIHKKDKLVFDKQIIDYVKENKRNNNLHQE
jgi:tetraacyldisaccharide 4'-kinase